jgi:hypothetical protein
MTDQKPVRRDVLQSLTTLPFAALLAQTGGANLWARLKEWRAVATRYEKTARSFLGVLCLAATADWLKH